MFIIDKNKDYYDYMSHMYGVDKKVVFDRRGSVVLEYDDLVTRLFDNYWYSDRRNYNLRRWGSGKAKYYFILESGYVQYLFLVTNIKCHKDSVTYLYPVDSFDIDLEHVFKENKNFFGSPLGIYRVDIERIYVWKKKEYSEVITDFRSTVKWVEDMQDRVILPILDNTKIPAFISAFDMWQNLSTYISSLNTEKDVSIPLTDKDKLINHGFDAKSSFRHPVK